MIFIIRLEVVGKISNITFRDPNIIILLQSLQKPIKSSWSVLVTKL